MQVTQQRFVHVGFGNMICANAIEAILIPSTACAKRQTKASKSHEQFFDLTFGRTTKSQLLLENGKLVGCALTPKTIAARINTKTSSNDDLYEGEDSNEDSNTISQTIDPK